MWSKIEKKFWEDKWILHPLTGFFQCLFVSSSQQPFLGSADITLGSWPFWRLQVACSHHHYTARYNNAEILSVWITRKGRHPLCSYFCFSSRQNSSSDGAIAWVTLFMFHFSIIWLFLPGKTNFLLLVTWLSLSSPFSPSLLPLFAPLSSPSLPPSLISFLHPTTETQKR